MGQGMAAKEPAGIEEITKGYLSDVAGKMLGDPSLEVTHFRLIHDLFQSQPQCRTP
jgi:hypothetical protein